MYMGMGQVVPYRSSDLAALILQSGVHPTGEDGSCLSNPHLLPAQAGDKARSRNDHSNLNA